MWALIFCPVPGFCIDLPARYGLPWAFPGWLGFGQEHNPYVNVSETARYISTWLTYAD